MTQADRPVPVDRRLFRRSPALVAHVGVSAATATVVAIVVIVQADVLATALSRASAGRIDDVAEFVTRLVLVLCAIAALRALAAAGTEVSAAWAMRRTRRDVTDHVLRHAERAIRPEDADLAIRQATVVTTGLDELEPYVRLYLPSLAAAAIIPLAAGVRILGADWLSAVIIAVTVPLIPIFMVLIGTMTEERTRRRWATLQRLSGHFADVLDGIPTLRLFGRVETATEAVRKVSDEHRMATMGTLRIAFLSALALELLATLSVAVVAVSVGLRLASGSLDLATSLVVLLLVPECYVPLRRVGAAFHQAQAGADAAADIDAILAHPVAPSGRARPTSGALEVAGVEVMHTGRVTGTSRVDLTAAPGEVVALVGRSGSGKSTVFDVIRGRVPSSVGSVTFAGVPVEDLEPEAWADRLAVALQRPVVTSQTVRDAVRGVSHATTDEVDEILGQLGLAGLGDRNPSALSGGQLRRVEIGRVIASVRHGPASIVLADEPTAHLDTATADAVAEALLSLAHENGAIVLIATHDPRLSAASDRLVALTPLGEDRPPPGDEAGSAPPPPLDLTGNAAAPDVPERTSPVRAVATVVGLARPARGALAGALGLGVLAEVCTLGLAGVAAWLILEAGLRPPLAELTLAVTGVRAFGVGKGVFRYAERLVTHDATLRVITEIRSALVGRLGELAPGGIAGWAHGDVVQQVVADVDRLVDLFARNLVPAASVLTAALLASVVTVAIDPLAGLVLGGFVLGIGVLVPIAASAFEMRVAPQILAARGRVAGAVLAYCTTIDALVAQRFATPERVRIGSLERAASGPEDRLARRRAVWAAIAAAAPTLAAAVIAAVVVIPLVGPLDPALGMVIIWSLAIIELTAGLIEPASRVPLVVASAQRVVGHLDAAIPVEPPGQLDHPRTGVPILLSELSARWPGQARDAVSGVDLTLAPGEQVVLTGPSGAGKSTVAAVMVKFLLARDGTYELSGTDARDLDGAAVRRHVTWVEQNPWFADSTVRQNLLLASRDATDEELEETLDAVGLGPWRASLAEGLDTRVGRHGSALSGGEAQRLALARILLTDHAVVVLDEPTAHLDRETAARVLVDLRQRMGGRSALIISHSLVDAALRTVTLGPPRRGVEEVATSDRRRAARMPS